MSGRGPYSTPCQAANPTSCTRRAARAPASIGDRRTGRRSAAAQHLGSVFVMVLEAPDSSVNFPTMSRLPSLHPIEEK